MTDVTSDPILLGQRVIAILETGARTATYKLATLMALVDHCIENLPAEPNARLRVPISDLAHRVLDLYWLQVRPFEGHDLRQSTQPIARVLRAVVQLREAAGMTASSATPLEIAMGRAPTVYAEAVDDVRLCLAQQPLHRLQRLPGMTSSDPFLYDDSFLHDHVSRAALRLEGNAIEMKPGVAHGLARLAGLLKPALEIMWVEDVRRMNRFLDAEVPDVAGHLFGRDRMSMAVVRTPFKEVFGARCFYCDAALPMDNPVDHVLPWSLLGIDGLANLVLSCLRCNGDKRHSLPATEIVDRVLDRDRGTLEAIARQIEWPTQYERVTAAARGLYRGQPPGSPTWSAYRSMTRLDLSDAGSWLSYEPRTHGP